MGDAVVQPRRITVRAARSILGKIASVRARIPFQEGVGSWEGSEAPLEAVGEDGMPILEGVSIIPQNVGFSVAVEEPFRDCGLRIGIGRYPAPGYAVQRITPSVRGVKIYGLESKLVSLPASIPLNLDLDNRRGDVVLDLEIPTGDSGLRAEPRWVRVKVTLVGAVQKQISNIHVKTVGSPSDGTTAVFPNSYGGVTIPNLSVTLSGAPRFLRTITAKDIEATVDVNGLGEGIHQLPIQVQIRKYPWVQILDQTVTTAQVQINRRGL